MVTAPAGCGKTEVLALRVLGLIERNLVCEPRKILVVTFTNKARDNIQSRLLSYLPQEKLRRFVYIANFHGLAARLISAHGAIDGIDGSWVLPSYDWVAEFRREHNTGKGQQFDWVFIAGCEEGVTPHFRAESNDQLLEEMRVFSVMLSRARVGVVATCATTVHDYDKGRDWPNRRQSPYFCLMRRAGALGRVSEVEAWFERTVQEL